MEVAAAVVVEAMSAPAVAIAPAAPWTHAQEDAVVEVSRSVIAHRCAGIRLVAIVAVRAVRLRTNIDIDLRLGR
jgi:hypothetical protein